MAELADHTFAVTLRDDAMQSAAPPSFRPGDLLVFSNERDARHRNFVFAVLEGRSLFRQLFLDAKGRVRLQPLNLDHPPLIVERDEVQHLFPLVTRVQTTL